MTTGRSIVHQHDELMHAHPDDMHGHVDPIEQPTPRSTPTTQAGRDLLEWAYTHTDHAESIEWVRERIAAAEARDATGLREALDRIDRRAAQQMNDASAEPFEWCARIVSAALEAAPQEPRWPSPDDEAAVKALADVISDWDWHSWEHYQPKGWLSRARAILAALREGAERS